MGFRNLAVFAAVHSLYSTALAEPPPDVVGLASVSALRGLLIADKQGYAVGQPQQIAGPNATEVLVSPDSRFVLSVCEERRGVLGAIARGKPDDVPGEQFIACYDTLTRRTTTLWRQPLTPDNPAMRWFRVRLKQWITTGIKTPPFRALGFQRLPNVSPTGEKLTDKAQILLIDPYKAQVKELPATFENGISPVPSHTQPFAVLLDDVEGGLSKKAVFLRSDGSLTAPITLPPASAHFWFHQWSADGTEIEITNAESYYAVDPQTGTVRQIPTPPKDAEGNEVYAKRFANPTAPANLPLRLVGKKNLYDKEAAPVYVTNRDGSEKVLLLGDGEQVALLPNGTGALVRANGFLFLCPIQAVPQSVVTDFRDRDNRDKTLALAQQIGSLLLLAAAENDKTLPAKDANLEAIFGKYLTPEIRDALKRFKYEPPANRVVTDRNAFRGTILGRLRDDLGSGKAAVRYAARPTWEPNP